MAKTNCYGEGGLYVFTAAYRRRRGCGSRRRPYPKEVRAEAIRCLAGLPVDPREGPSKDGL
ncbi:MULTISPECIES: hypothetical protein [unclassified Meiothermus]|uniref:hypothetical protein n=1 Tax=unclassified Meiothermus TaxID=370471 RepID=UPI000D7BAFF9|nr:MULTISPECIES: hypothetical protein [unclassified Meiothermus]PZA06040.1 hypothetical protein DNA98_15385 [Meiothermus sp. Pnk-1]RYM36164.1 hypothetical protein EWH23_11165 [Meiothermus sp. PNK-Is4]